MQSLLNASPRDPSGYLDTLQRNTGQRVLIGKWLRFGLIAYAFFFFAISKPAGEAFHFLELPRRNAVPSQRALVDPRFK